MSDEFADLIQNSLLQRLVPKLVPAMSELDHRDDLLEDLPCEGHYSQTLRCSTQVHRAKVMKARDILLGWLMASDESGAASTGKPMSQRDR